MHLLSTYVIKPISFDQNPYVLPRAAQFVKYGGANKYFQKHGNKPYHNQNQGGPPGEDGFNRNKAERKGSGAAGEIDDFETVAEKPKKMPRQPYNKLRPQQDGPGNPEQEEEITRKTSDVAAPQRKASDVQRKGSDVQAA